MVSWFLGQCRAPQSGTLVVVGLGKKRRGMLDTGPNYPQGRLFNSCVVKENSKQSCLFVSHPYDSSLCFFPPLHGFTTGPTNSTTLISIPVSSFGHRGLHSYTEELETVIKVLLIVSRIYVICFVFHRVWQFGGSLV